MNEIDNLLQLLEHRIMPFETIHLFCNIVKYGNISDAARAMGVTQSAASQRLKQLESQLGFDLFDRSHRPMRLSTRGQLYHEGCQEILHKHDSMLDRLSTQQRFLQQSLHISAIYSSGIEWLQQMTPLFQEKYPEYELRLSFLSPHAVHQAVLDEESELGLISYPDQWSGVQYQQIRTEPMGVVVHPRHRLAKYWELEIQDLEGQRLVFFEENLPISRHIMRYLVSQGIRPHISQSFDNIDSMKAYLARSEDLAILPVNTVKTEVEVGLLKSIQLKPDLLRPLGIIHQKTLSRAGQCFIDFLMQQD